jgi:hypothetical protein
MQRVRQFRVERDCALVRRDRFVELPLAEEIDPGVVVIVPSSVST